MNKIRVLPEILANKIAAGEIVERPASVVKELIENSIDAGSRAINVTVQSGGKRLIRVGDDGCGMSQDDAILAFEHHATSKLRSDEDLYSIATLGFRGEALPSIASISRLVLRTKPDSPDNASGTEITIHGGVLHSVKPVAWDRGTCIDVLDLFYNVPARRKFLKTNDTELGHIARHVTHYALAHPEIRFTLQSGERILMDAVAVPTVRERIYQVLGDGFLDNMVEFSGGTDSVRIYGYTSQPHEQRANAYSQYYYVNRRMVRDKVISGAVRQAYRRCIPASAYPVVILFLDMPFDRVDVNAHPAKTEIRFRDQKMVFSLVSETIERALSSEVTVPEFRAGRNIFPAPSIPGGEGMQGGKMKDWAVTGQNPMRFGSEATDGAPVQPASRFPLPGNAPLEDGDLPDPSCVRESEPAMPAPQDGTGAGGGAVLLNLDSVRILGQFRDSYIIASDRQGLLIIDQHVAHERILFENMMRSVRGSSVEVQGLLTPISLDLEPHQVALIKRALPEFEKSGFQVEPFGGASMLVRSVPAIAKGSDYTALVKEILDNLDAEERGLDLDRVREQIAIKTACRSAIKVNTPLSTEKMRWLIDQLARTRIPTNCPHGRPIILRFSVYEIEKRFGRV